MTCKVSCSWTRWPNSRKEILSKLLSSRLDFTVDCYGTMGTCITSCTTKGCFSNTFSTTYKNTDLQQKSLDELYCRSEVESHLFGESVLCRTGLEVIYHRLVVHMNFSISTHPATSAKLTHPKSYLTVHSRIWYNPTSNAKNCIILI